MTIQRTVRYQEPDSVLVIDDISSDAPNDYAQLWHLNPAHTHRIAGRQVAVCGEGTHAMLLTLEGVDRIDTVRGQVDPEPWGWHYPEAGTRVPNTVIVGRRHAKEARLKATIRFEPRAGHCER